MTEYISNCGDVATCISPLRTTDSHMRLEEGGWAKQTTTRELPSSPQLAGVNMRLKVGGVHEMHWHKAAEWSYMLKGKARITAVDQNGRVFRDDDYQLFASALTPPFSRAV